MPIRAWRARVWRAPTNPAEFSRWFGLEMTGAFQPGPSPEMVCTNEGPAQGVSIRADRLEDTVGGRLLTVTEPGFDGIPRARRAAVLAVTPRAGSTL
ncbi:MAG TPA: hypothetical protein VGS58_00275 [Candidatus Sulfopaludibacter sp.]|nr:hypothetical protein [Candidatus Sulfopaludibacter sp.]